MHLHSQNRAAHTKNSSLRYEYIEFAFNERHEADFYNLREAASCSRLDNGRLNGHMLLICLKCSCESNDFLEVRAHLAS